MARLLYAASVIGHIDAFHTPYIDALRSGGHTVTVMANGEGADINIPFEKKIFSRKNRACRKMIREAVRRGDFDAIVINTTLAAYHIRRAIGSHFAGRVVNVVHGYLFPMKKRSLKGRLMLLAEKLLKKRTDAVLVMNREDLEIAEKYKLSAEAPIFIPGMGATCEAELTSRADMRQRLNLEDKFVLTFVGELSGRKNQAYLITALPEIKAHIPNAHLLLVGEGDERETLTSLLKARGLSDSVTLLGKRSDPCDVIRASDLYVSASVSEGLPFNIIEALGVGIPIVASRVKGQVDLLVEGAGLLYDLEDKDSFVNAVSAVYQGEVKLDPTVAKATFDKYSFDTVFKKTYSAICKAVGIAP